VGNLVKNAIRFNYPDGRVDVVLSREDDTAVIEIADTGPGIPADELQNIFSKFYQVDGSSTRAVGGTGLGLAIAKRAVEAHGGRITVATAVGKGSTFTVRLPLRDTPPYEGGGEKLQGRP
jgi:signal transduction histidine kinase